MSLQPLYQASATTNNQQQLNNSSNLAPTSSCVDLPLSSPDNSLSDAQQTLTPPSLLLLHSCSNAEPGSKALEKRGLRPALLRVPSATTVDSDVSEFLLFYFYKYLGRWCPTFGYDILLIFL